RLPTRREVRQQRHDRREMGFIRLDVVELDLVELDGGYVELVQLDYDRELGLVGLDVVRLDLIGLDVVRLDELTGRIRPVALRRASSTRFSTTPCCARRSAGPKVCRRAAFGSSGSTGAAITTSCSGCWPTPRQRAGVRSAWSAWSPSGCRPRSSSSRSVSTSR